MSPPRRRPPPPGAGRGGRRPGRPRPEPGRTARAGPRDLGGTQVEGRQAVRELLLAGRRRVRDVWLADDLDPAAVIEEIVELAGDLRVSVRRVPRARLELEAHTEAPQGVLAHAAPLPEADFDELCRGDGRTPFLVVLDGVTDPRNLGAVLRSAEGSGATGAVLARHRAAHVSPAVTKAAAGAVEHLPIAVVGGVPAALARARELGVWVVGLDAAGARPVHDLPMATDPLALVLGSEGRGLGRLTRERCDEVAAIPLRGRLASLNVAAAAAVACFEVARQRVPRSAS